jgi:formylglycine-generating enzyme required for sulfatase activity
VELPDEVRTRITSTLAACIPWDEAQALDAVWSDERIDQWQGALTSTADPSQLVRALSDQTSDEGQNGLLGFLQVARDQIDEDEVCYQQLSEAIEALEAAIAPAPEEQEPPTTSIEGDANIVGDGNVAVKAEGESEVRIAAHDYNELHLHAGRVTFNWIVKISGGNEDTVRNQMLFVLNRMADQLEALDTSSDEAAAGRLVEIEAVLEELKGLLERSAPSPEALRQSRDFLGTLGWLIAAFTVGLGVGGGKAFTGWLKKQVKEGALRGGVEGKIRPKTSKPQAGVPRLDLSARHSFEPELVRIPAGEFWMGSDPAQDPDAYDREKPQHRVYLSEYYIAKTPITNVQYYAFVRATGHREPEYDWEHGEPVLAKVFCPVRGVSWHDAMAYCQWLEDVTRKPYALPSEAEWEKAARGTDGLIYPWGDKPPTDGLCNFGDLNRGTTPVGTYSPQGDSPYGCADMAGNVWEWTRSLWGEDWGEPEFGYPYDPTDGREDITAGDGVLRVLRGGAFGFSPGSARCAFRFRNSPDGRDYGSGFRVVVSPSSRT